MFSALQARYPNAGREAVGPAGGPSVFTTVVGRKPSSANYFLDDSDEVTELCQSLRLHSTRANRNRSMGDLQRLHTPISHGSRLGGVPAAPVGGTLDWSRVPAHNEMQYAAQSEVQLHGRGVTLAQSSVQLTTTWSGA